MTHLFCIFTLLFCSTICNTRWYAISIHITEFFYLHYPIINIRTYKILSFNIERHVCKRIWKYSNEGIFRFLTFLRGHMIRFCPCSVVLPGEIEVAALIHCPCRNRIWPVGIEFFGFVILYSFQDWGLVFIVDINLDFIEIWIIRVSPCPVDIEWIITYIR